MLHRDLRIALTCVLALACAPALAETKTTTPAPAPAKPAPAPAPARPATPPPVAARPATPPPVVSRPATSPTATPVRPSAAQQLSTASQGTAQRNHVFDGTKPPPGPVTANPGPKPSVVGTPVSQFKPPVRVTPSAPPPAPPRNLNPTGDKAVQKGIDSYKKPGT